MSPQSPPPSPAPIRDGWFRGLGILTLSVVMVLVYGGWSWPGWLASLLFTVVLWEGSRALWLALRRRLPRLEQTPRRLLLLGGLGVLFAAGASAGIQATLEWAVPGLNCGGRLPCDVSVVGHVAVFNQIPGIVVLSIYESIHFFQQWKASLTRAEALGRAQVQAQLEALQNQLDPHFLFNSLNTLAALIEPGNAPAQGFVEGLADVYRYVLLARERATVPLAEELAFVQTYLALQQVRFRDSVRVQYAIGPAARARQVAPLSVQLLVENALKHNVASQTHPLHLRLEATADTLRVAHNWQPRAAGLAPAGTGQGLANVRQRYELLGAPRPVVVQAEAGVFAVTLPLLS